MARTAAPADLIAKVDELRRQGRSVSNACRSARVPTSTYYRHASKSGGRFPALRRDWRSLATTFKPGSKKLSKIDRRDLRHDLAQAFSTTFGRDGHTRTGKQLADELEKLWQAMGRAIACFDGLSPQAQSWLDEVPEPHASDLEGPIGPALDQLRSHHMALPHIIEDLRGAKRLNDRGRGGPTADPRLVPLVTRLAAIYAKYIRQPPAHTFNAYGPPDFTASYNRFVLRAFRHFLKGHPVRPTALREAMRHAAARVDWQHDVARSEDQAFT